MKRELKTKTRDAKASTPPTQDTRTPLLRQDMRTPLPAVTLLTPSLDAPHELLYLYAPQELL